MKSRRKGSERWRIRSARNMTVPLSSETTTISRPWKSRSISTNISRMRRASCRSLMSMRSISARQRVGAGCERTVGVDFFFFIGHPKGQLTNCPLMVSEAAELSSLRRKSNVLRIAVVLFRVTRILPLEIDLVLLHVSIEDVIRAHAQHLGQADEEMKEIDDLHTGVLLVELLVFGPPFPRHAVGEFGHLLRHGAAIVEDPLRLFLFGHLVRVDADALVQGVLHAKEFAELIRFFHGSEIAVRRRSSKPKVQLTEQ